MSSHLRRRRVWLVGIVLILAAVVGALLLVRKSSVDGFYVVSSPKGQGHEFLFFTNGNVYACIDNHPMPAVVTWLGHYELMAGTGYVWTLRKLERRIRCDPYVLYMKFTAIDGVPEEATDPFEWRDPFLWKCKRTTTSASFLKAAEHE